MMLKFAWILNFRGKIWNPEYKQNTVKINIEIVVFWNKEPILNFRARIESVRFKRVHTQIPGFASIFALKFRSGKHDQNKSKNFRAKTEKYFV